MIRKNYLAKSPSPYPTPNTCTTTETFVYYSVASHKERHGTIERDREERKGEGWKYSFFPEKQAGEKQV